MKSLRMGRISHARFLKHWRWKAIAASDFPRRLFDICSWLAVVAPRRAIDAELAALAPGEREAIALAEELSADQLMVDEVLARREAERRGLPVMGTIGLLSEAAGEGLNDLRDCVRRLRQTSFHISPAILAQLLGKEP